MDIIKKTIDFEEIEEKTVKILINDELEIVTSKDRFDNWNFALNLGRLQQNAEDFSALNELYELTFGKKQFNEIKAYLKKKYKAVRTSHLFQIYEIVMETMRDLKN